jgi:hypothetical protein
MTIPDRMNTQWISSLKDRQLIAAEAKLYAAFKKEEKTEKARAGGRYMLLEGPPELVNAWVRWRRLSDATTARGLEATR